MYSSKSVANSYLYYQLLLGFLPRRVLSIIKFEDTGSTPPPITMSDETFYPDLLHDSTHQQINDSKEFVELVKLLPHYQLTIPEAVVRHHLQKVGCNPSDGISTKLIALATQKFAWDVLEGALGFERQLNETTGEETPLTAETLILALREHNIAGLDTE